jgi:hypothetical protein
MERPALFFATPRSYSACREPERRHELLEEDLPGIGAGARLL